MVGHKKSLSTVIFFSVCCFSIGCALILASANAQSNYSRSAVDKDVTHSKRETARQQWLKRSNGPGGKFSFRSHRSSVLRDSGAGEVATMLERSPRLAARTKVWVAYVDICDLPGDETIMHVEGPLTCGSAGCQMVVTGVVGGRKQIISRMVGDSISVPRRGEIIMNEGTKSETAWSFQGAKYKRRYGRIK